MKILRFMSGAFCAMGMMACSSSEDIADYDNNEGKDNNSFIAISVKSNDNATTRAVIDDKGDGKSGGEYEYGTDAESKVNKVCFYFFDTDGKAANVVVNPTSNTADKVNYFESVADKSGDESPNIETILNAMVIINTKNTEDFPQKIVAVINGATPKASISLSDLKATSGNYAYDAESDEGFLMSTTSYLDKDNKLQTETNVTEDNFKSTQEDAEKAPVTMHVERVLAKVSVATGNNFKGAGETTEDITLDGGEKLYYTGQTADRSADTGKRLYVRLLGWNVARQADNSYLIKNIKAWTDADLGITNWSWPNYFRSFWAMNPEDVKYVNNDYDKSKELKIGKVGDDNDSYIVYDDKNRNYTYVQENASPYYAEGGTLAAPKDPTVVIVPAELVDKEGKTVPLAEWKGIRSNIDGILASMANWSSIYYKTETGRTKITPDMIEFSNDCHAILKEEAKAKTFYLDRTTNEEAEVDAVNNELSQLGAAKVWKDGKTYYFTPIKHLGVSTEDKASIAEYGVVRNHSYQVVLNSVKGLGTPVYNPEEIIDPVSPSENESYLAAQIRVLSWRVVKSTVDLK